MEPDAIETAGVCNGIECAIDHTYITEALAFVGSCSSQLPCCLQ